MERERKWFAAVVLCVLFYVSGCSGQNQGEETNIGNENMQAGTEASFVQDEDAVDENLLQEYYALLLTTQDTEAVYLFLEEHIAACAMKDADQLLNGLIGYKTTVRDVDFNRIAKQRNYFSEEMQEFIDLMLLEQNAPAVADGSMHIALNEVLMRIEKLEEHALSYPEGVTFPYVYQKYEELLSAAITGFYDGTNSWSNSLLETDGEHVEEAALHIYMEFIRAYPNSNTAAVLQEYVDLLKESDQKMNRKITTFYSRIGSIIKGNFRVDES